MTMVHKQTKSYIVQMILQLDCCNEQIKMGWSLMRGSVRGLMRSKLLIYSLHILSKSCWQFSYFECFIVSLHTWLILCRLSDILLIFSITNITTLQVQTSQNNILKLQYRQNYTGNPALFMPIKNHNWKVLIRNQYDIWL